MTPRKLTATRCKRRCDDISDFELLHAGSDLDNLSDYFMAEDKTGPFFRLSVIVEIGSWD